MYSITTEILFSSMNTVGERGGDLGRISVSQRFVVSNRSKREWNDSVTRGGNRYMSDKSSLKKFE